MIYTVPHYIAGHKITEEAADHDIYNPALGEKIGTVGFADTLLCDKTVAAAKKAWPSWAATPPIKRSRILFKFRDLLERNQHDLAQLVTQEHGKTLEDAKASIARGIEIVETHCDITRQLQGTFSSNVTQQMDCHTILQPLGVCAGIAPFNFPVMVPLWMMVPAIASGNTFILKPSEQDPSAPVRLLELFSEAGLPDGVANCIHGNKATVEQLLLHPDIAAFTAVASTPVAEFIYTKATSLGKRAHTFGGAKNHAVVMPDADFKQSAKAIVGAAFGSAGERCMAISVVVAVGKETAEQLLQDLIPLIQHIRIDAGEMEGCDMGPVISSAHRQRIIEAINEGVNEGANLIIDGRDFKHHTLTKGFFIGPSLFDHVNENMSIYQKEIFGPVLVMVRTKNVEEAIHLINRNPYGNGTAIFTRDGFTAREYTERIQVGMVGINVPIPVPITSHPFGGWKNSSFGDASMHGTESIHFYTRRKSITSKWLATQEESSAFIMSSH